MHRLYLSLLMALGSTVMTADAQATPLDELRWKSRILVVSAPAGDRAAEEQKRIYREAARGMAERQIVLAEVLDDNDRSLKIKSRLSADGRRFQVFLVGKDGHTALSSDKPLSADYLFGKVDAMPMRRDEMRRGR